MVCFLPTCSNAPPTRFKRARRAFLDFPEDLVLTFLGRNMTFLVGILLCVIIGLGIGVFLTDLAGPTTGLPAPLPREEVLNTWCVKDKCVPHHLTVTSLSPSGIAITSTEGSLLVIPAPASGIYLEKCIVEDQEYKCDPLTENSVYIPARRHPNTQPNTIIINRKMRPT